MGIIKVDNISKSYKDNQLYEDAHIEIKEGTTVGIVGPNGSGKSVLFKLIAGLEPVDSGSIVVRDKLVGKDCDFPQNLGIFVNQPGYIEYYNGFQNLKMLAEIQGIIDDETIKQYMVRLGLDPSDKTKVKNYSSGMKQKLGIIQAIMENQSIILLDEPFNALDFQANRDIIMLLQDLKKEKKTIVLTSHQHEYLERLCDEIYMIINRKIVKFDEEMRGTYFKLFSD